MTCLELDHMRYIRRQDYRRELHARLRRLIAEEPHAVSQMNVMHEANNSCCRREPWPTTYSNLMGALRADGERVLGVVL